MNEKEQAVSMPRQQGFQTELRQQPKRLSDEEIGILLGGAANLDSKAMLLVQMQPNTIYSISDLYRMMIDAQAGQAGWKISQRTLLSYCEKSLCPIGLVASEVLDHSANTIGYMLTDFGAKVGRPFCALILDFSSRYPEIALIDLLGQTNSPAPSNDVLTPEGRIETKKRSPVTRLKIFAELVTAPDLPIRKVDLAERVGEVPVGKTSKTTQEHLRRLGEQNLIQYTATERGHPFSSYRLNAERPDDAPPPFTHPGGGSNPTLTNTIYNLLRQTPGKDWSIEEICNTLVLQDLHRAKQTSLYIHTSTILNHLMKTGYAGREKFSSGVQSEINLTDKQQAMLTDFVETVYGFVRKDPLVMQQAEKALSFFQNSPEAVRPLLQKAREHSPHANRTDQSISQERILALLSAHPNTTVADIQTALEQGFGKRLDRESIRQFLRILARQGRIKGIKKKATIRWSVVEN